MSKALEIDSSRRSLLKYTVAGLLAGFGGRLLPHVSSAYAATEGGAKALVVYYSRSGNTRAVAEAIHAAVGGDIVELQPVTPYPEAYRATTDQAKQELASGYKPPLKNRIGHIEAYDVVFVGSPNWWGTVAGPVRTFLSEYDLAGKRIAPFITHEGSALPQRCGHQDVLPEGGCSGRACRQGKPSRFRARRGGRVASQDRHGKITFSLRGMA